MLRPSPSTLWLPPRSAPTPPVTAEPWTEQIEVRTEPVDGVETPTQLLWEGRLWLVRSAVRQPGAPELWRVLAGSGPAAAPLVLSLRQHPEGRWSVSGRVVAAAEMAGWA